MDDPGVDSWQVQTFFSSLKYPDSPPASYSKHTAGYFFPRVRRQEHETDHSPYLEQKLRMSGVISPLALYTFVARNIAFTICQRF
jgi:hypothetical protein